MNVPGTVDQEVLETADGNCASSRPWLARFAGFAFWLALWCVALGLLSIAVLRIVWHDGTKPLTWLNAFTLYVYLPAYVVLVLAAWARRWRLAAVAALVVAFHLVWVAPDFRPATRLEPAASITAADTITIYVFNASWYSQGFDELIEELERVDPDVIAFAEFSPLLQQALRRAPFMSEFTYGSNLNGPYPGEVVVFSRLPTARPHPVWVAERPYIAIDVPAGDRELRLFALHSPRPMKWPAHNYDGFWEAVLPAIASQPRPLIVVGDFNATQHSWVYQQLMKMGLRSAHVDRGRGYATTWPNRGFWAPPIRIDHALISPDVECLQIVEGVSDNSDHVPLILDVRLKSRDTETPTQGSTSP